MSGKDGQLTLLGFPVVEVDALSADVALVVGSKEETRYVGGIDFAVGRDRSGTVVFREKPEPLIAGRAAFVRYHVGEIVKKSKTAAAHRTKAKKMLERASAVGDPVPLEESQAEYDMAAAADRAVELHMAALIERTAVRA